MDLFGSLIANKVLSADDPMTPEQGLAAIIATCGNQDPSNRPDVSDPAFERACGQILVKLFSLNGLDIRKNLMSLATIGVEVALLIATKTPAGGKWLGFGE